MLTSTRIPRKSMLHIGPPGRVGNIEIFEFIHEDEDDFRGDVKMIQTHLAASTIHAPL